MLDSLHARLVRRPLLRRFTAFTRLLLAVGFIPPGLIKVLGHRFTQLPTDNPIGYFFDAFFQAQEYYIFVGVAQVLAGLLLLWPRTATLGAVLYFPIILNVTLITWSIGFTGTRWITLLMTLACLWLLAWDYDRLKAILPERAAPRGDIDRREYVRLSGLGAAAGAAIGAIGLGVSSTPVASLPFALALVVGGATFGLAMAWHVRHLP